MENKDVTNVFIALNENLQRRLTTATINEIKATAITHKQQLDTIAKDFTQDPSSVHCTVRDLLNVINEADTLESTKATASSLMVYLNLVLPSLTVGRNKHE